MARPAGVRSVEPRRHTDSSYLKRFCSYWVHVNSAVGAFQKPKKIIDPPELNLITFEEPLETEIDIEKCRLSGNFEMPWFIQVNWLPIHSTPKFQQ